MCLPCPQLLNPCCQYKLLHVVSRFEWSLLEGSSIIEWSHRFHSSPSIEYPCFLRTHPCEPWRSSPDSSPSTLHLCWFVWYTEPTSHPMPSVHSHHDRPHLSPSRRVNMWCCDVMHGINTECLQCGISEVFEYISHESHIDYIVQLVVFTPCLVSKVFHSFTIWSYSFCGIISPFI